MLVISTESLKEEREEEEKRRRKEGFHGVSALVKTERVQHVQEELTAQKARGEYHPHQPMGPATVRVSDDPTGTRNGLPSYDGVP